MTYITYIILFSDYVQAESNYKLMGIPKMSLVSWLTSLKIPERPISINNAPFAKANQEIPTLPDYSSPPDESYWQHWPHKDIPFSPEENQGIINLPVSLIINFNFIFSLTS